MIQAAEPDMLYWADMGDFGVDNKAVWRINLDGTGREQILSGTHDASLSNIGNVVSILVDAARGHVYLGETFQNNKIRRVNLDGSGFTNFVSSMVKVYGMAMDRPNSHLYFTESEFKHICRVNLDGSGLTNLCAATNGVGIALDLETRKMYWAENPSGITNGVIKRANMDGTGVEEFVTDVMDPKDVALDIVAGKLYWSEDGPSFNTGRIKRCDLDGGNVETVCGNSLYRPVHIALDLEARRVYWCNGANDDVRYCDMSAGAVANDFVTDGNTVNAIALYLPPPAGTIFAFR